MIHPIDTNILSRAVKAPISSMSDYVAFFGMFLFSSSSLRIDWLGQLFENGLDLSIVPICTNHLFPFFVFNHGNGMMITWGACFFQGWLPWTGAWVWIDDPTGVHRWTDGLVWRTNGVHGSIEHRHERTDVLWCLAISYKIETKPLILHVPFLEWRWFLPLSSRADDL